MDKFEPGTRVCVFGDDRLSGVVERCIGLGPGDIRDEYVVKMDEGMWWPSDHLMYVRAIVVTEINLEVADD